MRASRIFALARTMRWATVGGPVRKARAISSVVRPQTSRKVSAICASGGSVARRVEAGAPAHCVDGPGAAGRDEPRPGIGGYAITRPPLYCCGKGVVQRFFGEVEVAEQADQGGEDAT